MTPAGTDTATLSALSALAPLAPAALHALLDATRGALLPPIRAEIFGPQRFAQHGHSLGETHDAVRTTWRSPSFFPRLRSNIRVLREARQWIGTQASTGHDLSPAAEWLLDNFHLIEAQLDAIRTGLPRSYFRGLPVLQAAPLAGLPRIYGVAWAFVAHTDSAFDEDRLIHFLQAYQQTRELTLGEMWALPTTLRVVLIESLRRLAERVAAHKAARELANRCCDQPAALDIARLDAVLPALAQRGAATSFLLQMALRLNDRHADLPPALTDWLARALPDLAALQVQQRADQTADNLSVSNAVTSLRAIGDADWPDLVARTSLLMHTMLSSPLFEAEAAATRDQTLHGIEQLARRSQHNEREVAHALLALMQTGQGASVAARHWLQGAGRPALAAALGLQEPWAQAWRTWRPRVALPVYLGVLVLGTLALVAWALPRGPLHSLSLLAALLALGPASEAVVAVLNRLVSESTPPRPLPRLAFAPGLPPDQRVMVAIPAMLTGTASAAPLAHRLLLHHLANPEREAQFALLTDWADAPTASLPSDAAVLAAAQASVDALNAQHPVDGDRAPRFILLHRARRWCATEACWIGWERKRGKLEELIAALATGTSTAFIDLGATSRIAPGMRYLVTLDSDTALPPGRLRELVGVAAHPHNQPRLDASGRRVVSGFSILQPRIVTPQPQPAERTRFHWMFAGPCGIDPYNSASSEVDQDLFGEGSFKGKGLMHVAACHAVLGGRLPEDRVLSHDLIEGALARCASLSDVTLIEDAPFHADVAASRQHRWMRGDWQLLPMLLQPWRWRLGALNRWKLFDNLRRSLVAPASLGLIVLALGSTAITPEAALALVMAALAAGPLIGALAGLVPGRGDIALGHFFRSAGDDIARAVVGALWMLVQLLHHARSSIDAIGRTLWRLIVTQRHLLQWTTAAAAQARASTQLRVLWRRHGATSAWSLGLMGLLLGPALGLWAWPTEGDAGFGARQALIVLLCSAWAASPLAIWWASRAAPVAASAALTEAQAAELAGIARDTWRYFERCVGPGDRHLPPDNLQTLPHDAVAHRTSPTNIGLYLLSAACARRFGWIGSVELIARAEATLATLDGLERCRGHFLNWYDTQSGAALHPMYVSTVDSGNFSGHLLAVAQALRELALDPYHAGPATQALAASKRRVAGLCDAHSRRVPAQRDTLRWCLTDHRATRRSAAQDASAAHVPGQAEQASARLIALAEAFERLAGEADFAFLYHRRRHLFHIGYRVAEQQLDTSYYDLLASEARLTSLVAIAQGSVQVSHWAALGRPFYALRTKVGLRSWSGSMFEYLMPGLVLDEPAGSVLATAGHTAVREQIAYAQAQRMPWGISESAHCGRDHTLAYQYAPQGVPRLALRRTPPGERVVAPYATALAAPLVPHQACINFALLSDLGARARYGFIEALDFSPARQDSPQRYTPVAAFFAHHQGMTIVALANLLLGDVARRWGMASPSIEAVSSLLQERVPREVARLPEPADLPPLLPATDRALGVAREVWPGAGAVEPTQLLSNGRYSVTLRANGAGSSHLGRLGLTRFRDDALRDACGSFLYLRWDRQPQAVSITQHPAPDAAAQYSSSFQADRVIFDTEWPELQARTTVWVSPEDDVEFRQVELRNLSDRMLDIELMSAFEATLADPRADDAHAAFSNLFVSATWLGPAQALHLERRPRLATETGLQLAHFLCEGHTAGDASSAPPYRDLRVQADRLRWRGRNTAATQPLAHYDPAPMPSGGELQDRPDRPDRTDRTDRTDDIALDTGLDPMGALSVRVRIEPHAKATLTFATAASTDGATLRAVIDKYRLAGHVERASLMSATLAGIRLRAQQLAPSDLAAIQALTTALVFTLDRPLIPPADAEAPCDRRLLWRFGISGDRPIVMVTAGGMQGVGLLRALAQALRLWSWGGVACDLVVISTEVTSYLMPLQTELGLLRDHHAADASAGPTQLHVLRAEALSAPELSTLRQLARVRLQADGRSLAHHLQAWSDRHDVSLERRRGVSTTPVGSALAPAPARMAAASTGAFDDATGEFRFEAGGTHRPQRPWINVLANPGFGAHLSEAGGGHTWAVNSRLNQITAWSNDPVADTPSECFVLQDESSGAAWSVAPSAWGDSALRYRISHGQGYSRIAHRRGPLDVVATWTVDADSAIKQVHLAITNRGGTRQRLRGVGLVEWIMGADRGARATVSTRLVRQRLPSGTLSALMCTQHDATAGFGGGTAFLALADGLQPSVRFGGGAIGGLSGAADPSAVDELGEVADWTCDRRELFDARGTLVLPDHFGQLSGRGLDPCAALSWRASIGEGETIERVFLIGHAPSLDAARQLAATAATVPAAQRLALVKSHWSGLLGAQTVQTPDPLFDVMVNRWLIYQTVACRLWAKAGFYQAGGASGFRDQLQDTLALSWAAPDLLREQILTCASRQFAEGDVQHWWHSPGGAGVRTHFSDDLLWLPHALAHHLRRSGEADLLDVRVPFLEGGTIPEGAEDLYETPHTSAEDATVYEHAARAIDHSLRVGVHGLPLMGTGDWNDGMNRVGHGGRGESVWLGFFLCTVVAEFAPIALARGDHVRALRWQQAATGWAEALRGTAWDGDWFTRAYFDDGQPLGGHANAEARIDLIAQAWSVLSGVGTPSQQQRAMASARRLLVDDDVGLLRLLDPPLADAVPSAGYIQAYPPGVRENGGQYSHGGVWALMAQARRAPLEPDPQAAADAVYRWFTYLNPAHRAVNPAWGAAYGIEPYVMAGDVLSQPPHTGRGGWSWYTGSAAWMHRAAIESIFGLDLQAQTLSFTPCLPSHWPRAELRLQRGGHSLRFVLMRVRPGDVSATALALGARVLRCGEPLAWPQLQADACFLLPLPELEGPPAAPPSVRWSTDAPPVGV